MFSGHYSVPYNLKMHMLRLTGLHLRNMLCGNEQQMLPLVQGTLVIERCDSPIAASLLRLLLCH